MPSEALTPIGLADLVAEHREVGEVVRARLDELARTGRFVLGPAVASFEQALAARCGVRHVVSLASGTDALALSLHAVGVQPGDLVVTTPLSFIATAEVIVRAGATPCFVDIDEDGMCLSPAAVRAYLEGCTRSADGVVRDPDTGQRVAALLPVHLFGRVADLGALEPLSSFHGVPIVHDAAQALGARDRGAPLGRKGPACVSFFPTKNLGAWGDGGAVLTDDAELAAQLRSLRIHGVTAAGSGLYEQLGFNSRLDAVQAVVLEAKLEWWQAHDERRRANAERYDQALGRAALAAHVRKPAAFRAGDVVHQYTLRVAPAAPPRSQTSRERREGLRAHLEQAAIGTAVYYPRLLCDQPAIAPHARIAGSLPVARRACDEVLSLPVHPFLGADDIARVVGALEAFVAA